MAVLVSIEILLLSVRVRESVKAAPISVSVNLKEINPFMRVNKYSNRHYQFMVKNE